MNSTAESARSLISRISQAARAGIESETLLAELGAATSTPLASGSVSPCGASEDGRGTQCEIAAAAERDNEIQRQLFTQFLHETRFRQAVGALLMVVFTAFCWGAVDTTLLQIWLLAGLLVLGLRVRAEAVFRRSSAFDTPRARLEFVRCMRPIYIVHGGVWGSSLLFYFDRIPVYDQFGCWLIVACVASAPLTSVALVPRLLRAYTNTLFLVLMSSMTLLVLTKPPGPESVNYLFLAVPLFHWWLLDWFGRRTQATQREQYGLQYDIARKEQEARAAVELKNRFLAAATHDLRQPVTALSLYAEHLAAHPEMHLELAPKIVAATQAVHRLFDSLFDLANLDSGRVHLNVQPVQISEVLECLFNQYQPVAEANHIALRIRSTGAVIRTDAVRLRRMIGNVLSNAIKYSPPGKKILLAARMHAGQLRVEVWDQGFGIPVKDIDKVFQEFYRVERENTAATDGIGLGLSIVSRLSRMLNARLRIDSVESRGTRFTLRLADVEAQAPGRQASLSVG